MTIHIDQHSFTMTMTTVRKSILSQEYRQQKKKEKSIMNDLVFFSP